MWPQSANSSHCKVTVCKSSKTPKFDIVCLFSSCQSNNWKKKKKRFSEATIYGNFQPATLSCFAANKSAACHIFTFHGSQHTPTPPLRALRLRWMAYLHSHVTPRGKGARLCASLTRSAAALALPLLFSTPRLGCCLGKPLLSLQPCPSVGRTGRLCPGENTEHLRGALCF